MGFRDYTIAIISPAVLIIALSYGEFNTFQSYILHYSVLFLIFAL